MQQATMQSGARTKHEGHETLIVHVSVVRIRDLLMPKEYQPASGLAFHYPYAKLLAVQEFLVREGDRRAGYPKSPLAMM
jgi:hypothetical protein